MAGYERAALDGIRAAVDLVALVGRYVKLRKAGATFTGLCPFHAEKTPSFTVDPRKGLFHCFGCGVGDDVFGFVMRQDGLTFPEAVRALARTAGIALPEDRTGADSGREDLLRVVDLAARFFDEQLGKPAGAWARAYLDQRRIDPDIARRFGLGYAPDSWEALRDFMRGERVSDETLVTVGLAVAREHPRDGVYDRFRNRLIFPIRDLQSRVVAFGGRALGDEQEPKYLNSPETPLYTKGNLLYAIDLARPAIREKNRALLVEGYVDCLIAHQYAFTETVATLGTAFTSTQLTMLRRQCDLVVMALDADAAGLKAAARAAELLESTDGGSAWAVNHLTNGAVPRGFRLKVALLDAGHDPDTFLRDHGAAAFTERIDGARSLLAYAFDQAMAKGNGRATGFTRAALMLAQVADADEADELSREMARALGVDATQLWIEAKRLQNARRPRAAASAPSRPALETSRTEDRALVRLLLLHPLARAELLPLFDEREQLQGEPLRAMVAALRTHVNALPASLMSELDESARNALAALLVEDGPLPGTNLEASVSGFKERFAAAQRQRRLRAAARGYVPGRSGG